MDRVRLPYLLAALGVNVFFLVTALSNVFYLRRSTAKPGMGTGPFVSVIIPARNEEASIATCVGSLLSQSYRDYEVIVVDDQSQDRTADIVADLARGNPRLRLVRGEPLPEGWLGKTHSLAQGAAAARGEILMLTDADSVHTPDSVSWAVTNMLAHDASLLSGYVRQEYGSFGEKLIVPTMYAMMLVTPLWLLPRTKSANVAFAIGQYVAIRRRTLDHIGGFEAIRDSIVDDMSMARRVKACGYREVFLDATAAASCRLYRGYGSAFDGISRSMYAALGGGLLAAAVVALVVLGVIAGPAFWALFALAHLQAPPALVTASAAAFASQWALVAWDRRVPAVAVALYPLVFLNLLAILGVSMMRTGYGAGADWKGRPVHVSEDRHISSCESGGADPARSGGARP